VQPLLQLKSNNYYVLWVYVLSLRYPAWNAHAPCCCPWPVWLYNIFPSYLANDRIFERKLLNIICVFWFSLHLCLKYFSFKKNWARYDKKIHIGHYEKCQFFLSNFNESWIFSKNNYQISLKFFQWEPSCSMRLDRYD